jgi:hypothetical protein
MAKFIGIVGESGSGKSTSIRTLDPKTNYVINVAGKELPFKGSSNLYNKANKNYDEISDAKVVLERLKTLSDKAPHIKTVVIEDSNYIMGFNMVAKALETGFTKFSLMAKDMTSLIQESKKLRDDLTIYYFTHHEEIKDSDEIVGYKMKTAGKLLDNQIKLEGLFTVVLYAIAETKGTDVTYSFVTNRYLKYPAKSPMGMFSEVKIPNDLQLVDQTIRDFYI